MDQLNCEQLSTHLQYSTQTVQRCVKQLSVMSNGTVYTHTVQRCVKWLSAMSISTAHIPNGVALLEMAQSNVEQHSVRRLMQNGTAYIQPVQRCVKWLSVMQNGTEYIQTVQRCVKWLSVIYFISGEKVTCLMEVSIGNDLKLP